MTEKQHSRLTPDHFTGCLIAGAVGDALGAPIEFMTLDQIRRTHGESGLTGYVPIYGQTGAITDDTQMMLFTAEGLILSRIRQEYPGEDGMIRCIYHALLRWLTTQQPDRQNGLIHSHGTCAIVEGVLTGYAALFSRRAPGNTCLSALISLIITGHSLTDAVNVAILPHWIDDLELNNLIEETAMDLYDEFASNR